MIDDRYLSDNILNQMRDGIVEKFGVRLLAEGAFGSRRFGTHSPTSDYDYQYVYVNRPEAYLTISKGPRFSKEAGEYTFIYPAQNDNGLLIDARGFDLKLFMSMCVHSKVGAHEFVRGIAYPSAASQQLVEIQEHYQHKPTLVNSYYGTARGALHSIEAEFSQSLGTEPDLRQIRKQLLVATRNILTGDWLQKRYDQPPLSVVELAAVFKYDIEELVDPPSLSKFSLYMDTWRRLSNEAKAIEAKREEPDFTKANEFFYAQVKESVCAS